MIPHPKKRVRKGGTIQIIVQQDENQEFRQAALRAHMNLSTWIRTRLWSAARREKAKLPPEEVKP